jgi:hypothetical protein
MKVKVFKIGFMTIMVLLGLTAVAPEWLDLKDMVLGEQQKEKFFDKASAFSAGVS